MKITHLLTIPLFLFILISSSFAATNPGLCYSYYEGSWSFIPNFDTLHAAKTGNVTNVDIGIRNRNLNYAISWNGYIDIPKDGIYTFETNSDDGSKLQIDNKTIVNNDGLHWAVLVSGTDTLKAGKHKISVSFLQGSGSGLVEVYWASASAGISRQKIPDNVLSYPNPETVNNRLPGLKYNYYEGAWSALPKFDTLAASKSGTASNINVYSIRNPADYTNYSILWQGFITIPASGMFTFETKSDDGSKLYIGDYFSSDTVSVVNNDGAHGVVYKQDSVYLAAGVYPISIAYFNACCSDTMDVFWASSAAGISRQHIPNSAFSYAAAPVPSPLLAGLNYKYYEGSWSALPDFSLLTPVDSGNSYYADLSSRHRDSAYAFLWQGYITVPSNGLYKFETISKDGSKLYIGSYPGAATQVVANDFRHAPAQDSGAIYLAAGTYPFAVVYFNGGGSGLVNVYWSSNTGITRTLIPNDVLSRINNTPETGGLTAATNYYFSSAGNDANSGTMVSPWKTLAKLNTVLAGAGPGTAFLLKRGDVFSGSIQVTNSGSSSAPIIISAYGSGPKPVVTGFVSPSSWTQDTIAGVWKASVDPSINHLNMVVKDGQIQVMGRYPNATAPNKGYLTYNQYSGTSNVIQGTAPGAYPNWVNAYVVVRKTEWIIDRGRIVYYDQPNSIIGFISPDPEPTNTGYGYFYQNSPLTLDQMGEWYYDTVGHTVSIFSGRSAPSAYNFRISNAGTLINVQGKDNIKIDNIALEGGNDFGVFLNQSNNITIQNSSVDFTGINGIEGSVCSNLVITGNSVNHSNNTGMYLAPACTSAQITNNLVKNTGLIPGLGKDYNQALVGITAGGSGAVLQYNSVDSIGYIGITVVDDNIAVINNVVNHFDLTTDDGAGIYTSDHHTGRKFLNNIVLNGKGSHEGTPSSEDRFANGIGTDDLSSDVLISGNTVANCTGQGIGLHNSDNLTIRENTFFNNKTSQIEFDHDVIAPSNPNTQMTVKKNIFFAKTADQKVFTFRSLSNDLNILGTLDSNYYCRPLDDKLTFHTFLHRDSQDDTTYNLAHWQSITGYDLHSQRVPYGLEVAPYILASADTNTYANSDFASNDNDVLSTAGNSHSRVIGDPDFGTALKITYSGSGDYNNSSTYFYNQSSVNPDLLAGHTYRLKFKIRGSVDNNTDFYARFQTADTAYHNLWSNSVLFKVYNTATQVEILFTLTEYIPKGYIVLYTNHPTSCPIYYVDSVLVQEVKSISYTNPDDFIRFEFNATNTNKTIALDAEYSDVKGTNYPSSVTLLPYTSVILIKGHVLPLEQLAKARTEAANVVADIPVNAMGLTLSPNPATNHIMLSYPTQSATGQSGVFVIYNASGAVVKSMSANMNGQPLDLNVSGFTPGIYTVRVISGTKSSIVRFVKF